MFLQKKKKENPVLLPFKSLKNSALQGLRTIKELPATWR